MISQIIQLNKIHVILADNNITIIGIFLSITDLLMGAKVHQPSEHCMHPEFQIMYQASRN
jgi:hypothetical protein